jgi:enoyl-CoA hydratase
MAKVETERRGRSIIVTINRPQVHNCVDGETAQLLFEAVESFRTADELDVLVLTGAGNASFCSGADLKDTASLIDRPGSADSGPMGISRLTDLGKPTIAAVNGYCLAGGLELACWCDFRIASVNASFGDPARRWGVPLVDGGTQRLPRIVGLGNALYLIEIGVVIDADLAWHMGLVQEVVPERQALSRALELAEAMSKYPQTSLRNDRRAAYEGLSLPLAQGLRLEARIHRSSLAEPEMEERVRQYAAGERPPFPRPTANRHDESAVDRREAR